ncbi:hypothetical protein QE429_004298 [Bacillus sp. SORGH_AS 510]|nr:hypothetical protein [Bacillus sp. SORGH_AS_0510]
MVMNLKILKFRLRNGSNYHYHVTIIENRGRGLNKLWLKQLKDIPYLN